EKMAASAGAPMTLCLLALLVRSAAAFRALPPESAHLQATEAEMRSFLDGPGEADREVLAAAGVLAAGDKLRGLARTPTCPRIAARGPISA
ncbi:unnamed protein product, partial [Prorocentrum cordatum]